MSITKQPATPEMGGIDAFRTEPWNGDFSLDYYFELADAIQRDGRQLCTFTQAEQVLHQNPQARIGLLRHDIDESPADALALARLEAERNLPATYFVIPNSEHYNITDPEVLHTLGSIANLPGLEVGLHYNPNSWRRQHVMDVQELEKDIREQADTLAEALGKPIRSVAFHMPGSDHPTWMNGPERLGGLHNAYAGVYMSPAEGAMYATDSGGSWSFGEPKLRVKRASEAGARVLQILTHAEWWLH